MPRGSAAVGEFFPGSRRRPIVHGTIGGYRAHFRHGVPMCEPCRQTERDRRGVEPFRWAVCGTRGGYNAHRRRGETTCGPCRAAHTAYQRAYRTARRAAS